MTQPSSTANKSNLFYVPPPPRRSPLRRAGCIVAVILWFMLVLTPCFCIALASQGEIAIRLGDVPGQSLRFWLLNEPDERGIGISRPSIHSTHNMTCMQTDVSFLLWQGQAEGSTFCDCYQHEGEDNWSLTSSQSGICQP